MNIHENTIDELASRSRKQISRAPGFDSAHHFTYKQLTFFTLQFSC